MVPFTPDSNDESTEDSTHKEMGTNTDHEDDPEEEQPEVIPQQEEPDVEKYLGLIEKFFYRIQS